MADTIPVTIVGGGLAGLTLGIALRQHNVPVQLHEAGHYPRHRVCGEFISGHGQASLERLGLRSMLDTAGAIEARTIAFFSSNRSTGPRLLPSAGICLSRSILDAMLATRFRDLGGELVEGERDVRGFGEGVNIRHRQTMGSAKQFPVQRAVLDRLQDVGGADVRGTCQIRQGSGDLEDPVMGAGGKIHLFHCVLQIAGAF